MLVDVVPVVVVVTVELLAVTVVDDALLVTVDAEVVATGELVAVVVITLLVTADVAPDEVDVIAELKVEVTSIETVVDTTLSSMVTTLSVADMSIVIVLTASTVIVLTSIVTILSVVDISIVILTLSSTNEAHDILTDPEHIPIAKPQQ